MPLSKLDALRDLYVDWAGCERCPLCATRRNMVFADGAPDARVMIIGEKPNYQEDKYGKPLIGPTGQLMGELIEKATGVNADTYIERSVHVTNLVMCRPPKDRSALRPETDACWPRLREQIRIVDPWLIIALGGAVLDLLVSNSKKKAPKVKRKRGDPPATKIPPMSISKARGEIIDIPIYFPSYGTRSFPVMPLIHPSVLLQHPDMNEGGDLRRTLDDLDAALKVVATMEDVYERQA